MGDKGPGRGEMSQCGGVAVGIEKFEIAVLVDPQIGRAHQTQQMAVVAAEAGEFVPGNGRAKQALPLFVDLLIHRQCGKLSLFAGGADDALPQPLHLLRRFAGRFAGGESALHPGPRTRHPDAHIEVFVVLLAPPNFKHLVLLCGQRGQGAAHGGDIRAGPVHCKFELMHRLVDEFRLARAAGRIGHDQRPDIGGAVRIAAQGCGQQVGQAAAAGIGGAAGAVVAGIFVEQRIHPRFVFQRPGVALLCGCTAANRVIDDQIEIQALVVGRFMHAGRIGPARPGQFQRGPRGARFGRSDMIAHQRGQQAALGIIDRIRHRFAVAALAHLVGNIDLVADPARGVVDDRIARPRRAHFAARHAVEFRTDNIGKAGFDPVPVTGNPFAAGAITLDTVQFRDPSHPASSLRLVIHGGYGIAGAVSTGIAPAFAPGIDRRAPAQRPGRAEIIAAVGIEHPGIEIVEIAANGGQFGREAGEQCSPFVVGQRCHDFVDLGAVV